MPKVRPVHLHLVASGLWLIQAVEGHSLLVDTHPWVPSQWGTEGAGLELLQDPGCARAHGVPGDMQGGRGQWGPWGSSLLPSSVVWDPVSGHFQPWPVMIRSLKKVVAMTMFIEGQHEVRLWAAGQLCGPRAVFCQSQLGSKTEAVEKKQTAKC